MIEDQRQIEKGERRMSLLKTNTRRKPMQIQEEGETRKKVILFKEEGGRRVKGLEEENSEEGDVP